MSSKPVRVLAAIILSCGFLLAGETSGEASATTPVSYSAPQTVQFMKAGVVVSSKSMKYAPVPKPKLAPVKFVHNMTAPPTMYNMPLAIKAYDVAKAQQGKPYVWGAVGPSSFDCSGLVYYSYHHVGKNLPRVAIDQYQASQHVSASSRRVGDLIFFGSPGSIYHVGFYAGNGYMWDAPHTGSVVKYEKIWSSNVHYGRF